MRTVSHRHSHVLQLLPTSEKCAADGLSAAGRLAASLRPRTRAARSLPRLNDFRLIGCRSLRSLVLCCRFWRLARRAPRALLVRAPGSPPGRKRGSGASRYARPFAPCGRLRRPRSRAAPALRRRALPAVPLPRAFAVGATPCARGSRPPAVGRSCACWLCRSLRSLGDCSRGSPRASGGLIFPPPHPAKFFCAPVRKLGKIRPQKTAKDPRFSGVFSSLDNIGGNCRAFCRNQCRVIHKKNSDFSQKNRIHLAKALIRCYYQSGKQS